MRNALNLFIAATLMTGVASAQKASESVPNIMDELMAYTESSVPAADKPAPKPVVEAVPAASAVMIPETAQEVVSETEVDVLVDTSRDQYLRGDFSKAREGFEKVVQLAPENLTARMYLRTLLERDHRTAEIEGMAAVDAAWSTQMVLRPYALASNASETLGMEDTEDAMDVEGVFTPVDFPKGSSAIYEPETKILFVRNTLENLAVLEAFLDAMEILKDSGARDQVEIETKFIEISEGTLEELGFQWNFADPTRAGIGGADLEVADGAQGLFSAGLRGGPASPGLPFSRLPLSSGALPSDSDWQAFRLEDTFNSAPAELGLSYTGGNAFDLLISALDQSSGADVLSAPRIVTKSGEEATIRVGERHFFPEVYEGDASQATIVQVNYEDFEEKLLGVELSVTPEVDGNEITLGLNPRILELTGWRDYALAPADYIYTHRLGLERMVFNHKPIVARLPVFKKREIETEVTIADGSTIGMGGLMSEKIEDFEDKVPVLGSLPLVGRFFRNEGERVVKRNLLMFVTAKIVDPNGRISTSRSFE